VVEGDTVQEVLSYVQYDRPSLVRQIRNAVEAALSNKTISLEESRLLLRYYEDGLNGYTYLDTPTADADLSAVDALRKIGQRQAVVGNVPTQEVVANANGQTLATQDKL
jgi:hypothetical protein